MSDPICPFAVQRILHPEAETEPVIRPVAFALHRFGFNAKAEQLRALLHMNWAMTVMANQDPPSANDNLVAWTSDTEVTEVYGFCEPMRFLSMPLASLVGAEWFGADQGEEPGTDEVGVKSTMKFGKCRRFQPQTQPSGPFV